MPIKWSRAEKGKFDRTPERKPARKIDPEWEELMAVLVSGEEVEIPYNDEKERGRIARMLGRRAVGKGIKVETRWIESEMVIVARKSEEALAPKQPKEPTTNGRRGRRKASAEEAS